MYELAEKILKNIDPVYKQNLTVKHERTFDSTQNLAGEINKIKISQQMFGETA